MYLRYYSDRDDILLPTIVRVESKFFNPARATRNPIEKHPNAAAFNVTLNAIRVEIEARILAAPGTISADYLKGTASSNNTIKSFIEEIKVTFKGKLSPGTLRHYDVIKGKIEASCSGATFSDVSLQWLQQLEKHIRDAGAGPNTVDANMGKVISILNKAEALGLIDEKQYSKYRRPGYQQGIPVYLEEDQIGALERIVFALPASRMKLSGYYFLLSCYAGYRINGLMTFRYEEMVRAGKIVLRAKKNGIIVSIPVYPQLAVILEFCKDNILDIYEQDMREDVKALCKLAGIPFWKDVKPHSGRHTFAMLMLEKGLTKDEVAELLGDSKDIAAIYARITNKQLQRRVLDVMGGKG